MIMMMTLVSRKLVRQSTMLSHYEKSMENIFLLSEISFGSWDTGDGFTDECIAD